jgi:hypothetical protein
MVRVAPSGLTKSETEGISTTEHRADWRPLTAQDWRRMRALLRDLMMHLQHDAEDWEQAARDLRVLGGEARSSIDFGRYLARAKRCRELAARVEDEYLALEGSHKRQVPLDLRGMFPGTQAP